MSGHPPCNRVDTIRYFNAFFFKQSGDLFENMLSLGNCKPVSRHNYYFIGIRTLDSHIISEGFLNGFIAITCLARAAIVTTAKRPEEYVHKRAVHCFTHYVCEDQAGSTHKCPTDNQQIVSQNESCH